MSPWMIAIFSALAVVLTTGKRDNRMLSFPAMIFQKNHHQNMEPCRKPVGSNENYVEDDLNLRVDKKMKNFYNLMQNDFDPDNGHQKDYDQNLAIKEIHSNEKRGGNSASLGCDCQVKNDVIDLGYSHYPRYLINAICTNDDPKKHHTNNCWRGQCRPVEYKVRVLTYRTETDILENDHSASLLPDVLRPYWKFKTVTVATGCFCSY